MNSLFSVEQQARWSVIDSTVLSHLRDLGVYSMQGDGDRFLIYFESEEHIVRRLGAAVVASWTELEPHVQDMLISRAERIVDEEQVEDFKAQIQRCVLDEPTPHALA